MGDVPLKCIPTLVTAQSDAHTQGSTKGKAHTHTDGRRDRHIQMEAQTDTHLWFLDLLHGDETSGGVAGKGLFTVTDQSETGIQGHHLFTVPTNTDTLYW